MPRTRKKLSFHASRRARMKFVPLITRQAFTLVELLVVIAIIGLLSTVAVVALDQSRINARNAKRKADLTQISKALELYYADNGSYPTTGGWWGSCPAYNSHPNTGPTGWVPNLAPTYMSVLPSDPTNGKNNSPNAFCDNTRACYLYFSDGTDYKVMAFCTPEGSWTSADPFYDPMYQNNGWSIKTPNGNW